MPTFKNTLAIPLLESRLIFHDIGSRDCRVLLSMYRAFGWKTDWSHERAFSIVTGRVGLCLARSNKGNTGPALQAV
jgi:hypothetical protein